MTGWAGSDRKHRLPREWHHIRARVLKRDPICTCQGCPRCSPTGCTRPSTDCDHLTPGDNHTETNLAGKCGPCHAHKSSAEGVATREHLAAQRLRPRPRHPGAATCESP